MPKLSHENLEKHARCLQEIWFDPVSEYLDKLVRCDQFEPLEENSIDVIDIAASDAETENTLPSESAKPELPTSTRKSKRSSRRNRKRQNVAPLPVPVAESQPIYQPPLHDPITFGIATMATTPAEQLQEPTVKNEEIKHEVIGGVNANLRPGNRRSERNNKQSTDVEGVQAAVKTIDISAHISPVIKTAATARRRKSDKLKEQPGKGQDQPLRENCDGNPDHPAAIPIGGSEIKPLIVKSAHNPKIPHDSHGMPASGSNNGSVKKNRGYRRRFPKPGITKQPPIIDKSPTVH